jgi:predicted nuclease of predicted toxin-antitoxin system
MKLLFDQNLSFKLCQSLSDLFPGSSQARLLGLANASDKDLWDYAGANGFVLVSLDADFAEMVGLLGSPPKIIWLRCGNQPTAVIEALLRNHADAIRAFDLDPNMACIEVY